MIKPEDHNRLMVEDHGLTVEQPLKQRDLTDLAPEMIYAISVMRQRESPIRPDVVEKPYMCCDHVPTCTYDTMFKLLGMGVLIRDEQSTRMGHYFLAEDWR